MATDGDGGASDGGNGSPRPRGPDGKFAKGQPPPTVRRRKGSKNKIPRSTKEVINHAAAMVGSDGKGQDGIEGLFVQVGRRKPEVLAGFVVHGSVPKAAKGSEDVDAEGGMIRDINIIAVPSNQFLCSFEEAETLRKLKAFPGATDAILALTDAVDWGSEPPAVDGLGDAVELIARLSRIPGAMTSLRMLLAALLPAAEARVAQRATMVTEAATPSMIAPPTPVEDVVSGDVVGFEQFRFTKRRS